MLYTKGSGYHRMGILIVADLADVVACDDVEVDVLISVYASYTITFLHLFVIGLFRWVCKTPKNYSN